jgi:hypothetical protein
MNNGMITIELGGVSTSLTFGMMAIEEFGNLQAVGGAGWAKLMTDLVYAGYCNEETLCRRAPSLSYREIAALLDDLVIDKSPILGDVFKCFENSKAGAQLLGSVKKKLEQPEKPEVKKESKRTGTKSKNLRSEN